MTAYFTDQAELAKHYRKIVAGIIDPSMEVLRQFCGICEVFDDRFLSFTAGANNVWGIEESTRVKMRLAHYFKIKNERIVHEIVFESW